VVETNLAKEEFMIVILTATSFDSLSTADSVGYMVYAKSLLANFCSD
jgi:hypothetical protein